MSKTYLSRDMMAGTTSWASSSDRETGEDSEDDEIFVEKVRRIRWLELMTSSQSGQSCREHAREMAQEFWILQRRARIHEAHKNLQEVRKKLGKPSLSGGLRKARGVDEIRRSYELRLVEEEAIHELSALKAIVASEVLDGTVADDARSADTAEKRAEWFREDWLFDHGLRLLGQQAHRAQAWFDEWVEELNHLTPAYFMQIVTSLAVEDGQRGLQMLMESLSLDLCWFGAQRRVESSVGSQEGSPQLSEWDPARCDLSTFRIAFRQHLQDDARLRDELTASYKKFPDTDMSGWFGIASACFWDAARRLTGGGGVFQTTYSITPAVRLLNTSNQDLSLMLKALVDAGQESRCFTTVISKAMLNEALKRTALARAVDWLVDMAYLVILLYMACAVNRGHKPARAIQVSFFCVSIWVAFSLVRKLGGGLALFSASPGGFVAGLLKHTKLWNFVMSFTELFSTYFAYRFLVYIIWDTGEGAWKLFRLHPGFLSFLVLIRWTQLAIGLLQIEQLGRNVVPVVHAISRPESLSFLFFLCIVVLGSFHAYYVFPIKENTGTFSHVMNTFLKIFRLEILGDFSLSELEGLGDQLHGTIRQDHTFSGEVDSEAADNEFHKSLRAEFVVLSLVVNVVFLNVYIGLLGELYARAVQRKSQLYNHYLASYAYRNLSRWCHLPVERCGRDETPEDHGDDYEDANGRRPRIIWVAYNRAHLVEESEA